MNCPKYIREAVDQQAFKKQPEELEELESLLAGRTDDCGCD